MCCLLDNNRKGLLKTPKQKYGLDYGCHLLQQLFAVFVYSPVGTSMQTCYDSNIKLLSNVFPAYSYIMVLEVTFEC